MIRRVTSFLNYMSKVNLSCPETTHQHQQVGTQSTNNELQREADMEMEMTRNSGKQVLLMIHYDRSSLYS